MKILLIHRYFWPDTPPYAVILKNIAKRLAEDGHDVQVFSTQPGYKQEVKIGRQPRSENLDGYKIYRCRLLPEIGGWIVVRVWNMILFGLLVIWQALKHRHYDIMMVSTSPPLISGLSVRIAARISHAKFLYHCMDIHPEIGRISGDFANTFLFRFLQRIDAKTCRRADCIIVLSDDMKQSILSRGEKESEKIKIIPNCNPGGEKSSTTTLKYKKEKNLRLIFAGNIGRFQALDFVVDAFLLLKDTEIELLFLGDGKKKNLLQKKVADAGAENIRFISHQPIAEANCIIETADLGIVSLAPDIYRYAYPTKMITYLSLGCPILSVMESESSLVSFIRQYEIGVNVNPGDAQAFGQTVMELNQNRVILQQMSQNALSTFNKVYNEKFILDKWSSTLKNI